MMLLGSCEQKSGPCDYDQTKARVEVVGIREFIVEGEKRYKVRLSFSASGLAQEDQFLDEFRDERIDSTFVAFNRISVGRVYLCTVSERRSGNCAPLVVSFNNQFRISQTMDDQRSGGQDQ